MKYLVTARRNMAPFPEGQGSNLVQAAKDWVSAQLANGTFDCIHNFAEGNGGFSITNADSHEAVFDLLLDYPLYLIYSWEIRPLCEWSHTYDKYIEWWKQQGR